MKINPITGWVVKRKQEDYRLSEEHRLKEKQRNKKRYGKQRIYKVV